MIDLSIIIVHIFGSFLEYVPTMSLHVYLVWFTLFRVLKLDDSILTGSLNGVYEMSR